MFVRLPGRRARPLAGTKGWKTLCRDLQDYAEPSSVSPEELNRIARDAGFPSRSEIGAFLRTFISSHHDTLAVPID